MQVKSVSQINPGITTSKPADKLDSAKEAIQPEARNGGAVPVDDRRAIERVNASSESSGLQEEKNRRALEQSLRVREAHEQLEQRDQLKQREEARATENIDRTRQRNEEVRLAIAKSRSESIQGLDDKAVQRQEQTQPQAKPSDNLKSPQLAREAVLPATQGREAEPFIATAEPQQNAALSSSNGAPILPPTEEVPLDAADVDTDFAADIERRQEDRVITTSLSRQAESSELSEEQTNVQARERNERNEDQSIERLRQSGAVPENANEQAKILDEIS